MSNHEEEDPKINKEEEYFVPNDKIKDNIVLEDSLLFIIAEKLFFDFNQIDLSIDKHKEIIKKYPNSKYSLRSKKIVDQLLNISTINVQDLICKELEKKD